MNHPHPTSHTPPLTPPQSPSHTAPVVTEVRTLRAAGFRPARRRWPGFLAAGVVGAAIAAAVVSSYYDHRTLGQRLDAGIAATERGVRDQVDGLRDGAAAVVDKSAEAGEKVAASVSDAGITASVKAALAADPALSVLKISVETHDGIVSLRGPAPDAVSRDRAAVLASAPEGVRGVDNQLQVTPSASQV